MILVDSNIFIEYYKNNSAICKVLEQIAPQEIVVSDVVCAELYFGARNKQELANIVSDMGKLTRNCPSGGSFSTRSLSGYCPQQLHCRQF